jgi:pimeloyl-ACP methyl ester carboxylesterase
MEPMKRRLQSNGISLAYEERGSGDPLVLIMGLGAPGSVWEQHALEYEKHFRCFLVDNRGAGDSAKPEGEYTTAQMAEDYAGLIRGLNLGRVRVAGLSMGGGIAQELALRHPDLVRSIVMACAWARCGFYMRAVFEHFAKMRSVSRPEDFVQLLQLWIWTPGWMEEHADEILAGQREAAEASARGEWMPLHAFEAQCRACIQHDASAGLGKIGVPVLLTAGSDDIFVPMRCAEELHRLIAQSELRVFEGRGHVHHWEALEEFNQLTSNWLLAH